MPFEIPSEFWGIGGFIVGVIGLIVGAIGTYIGFVGRNKFLMEYEIKSTYLVSEEMSNIPGLKISFNNQQIKSLISSTVKFINSGNQTINSDDFAKAAPIRIKASGNFLVGDNSYHISTNNLNSAPTLRSIDSSTYELDFDFLKKEKFLEISLLHDGELTVSGELKPGEFREHSNRKSKNGLLILISISLVFTVLISFVQSYLPFAYHSLLSGIFSAIIIMQITTTLDFIRSKDK